jgi:hypothetical protein
MPTYYIRINTDLETIAVRKPTFLDNFNEIVFGELCYTLKTRFAELGELDWENIGKTLEQISNYYRDKL